jgi:hypothetical protein
MKGTDMTTITTTPIALPSPISSELDARGSVRGPWGSCTRDWWGRYEVRVAGAAAWSLGPATRYESRAAALAACEGAETARLARVARAEVEAARIAAAEQAAAGDARALLAVPALRKDIERLIRGDKAPRYGEMASSYAGRKVISQAKVILVERAARRADRKAADNARTGQPGRILGLVAAKRRAAAAKRAEAARQRLVRGLLGREPLAKLLDARKYFEEVSREADGLVRSVVRAVGPIGEQAESDLAEMETGERFSGKRGRNHRLERSTVTRVERLADWSAVLLTIRDYSSFGSANWGSGDSHYGSRGGSSYRCYLIVRDSTTREAHILRVPPKFGNSDTQFFGRLDSAAERIRAAVAWTFGRGAGEYRPDVEA